METASAPALRALARTVAGPAPAALRRLLVLLCEQLGMDAAYVSTVSGDGTRTVRLAVTATGEEIPSAVGLTEPVADSWCGRVLADGVSLVPDVARHPELAQLPATETFAIVSHAGAALTTGDGRVVGTLCAFGQAPHASLNDRDAGVLVGLGEVVLPWLLALDEPLPSPRPEAALARVADAVSQAASLEELSRPLLDVLNALTGLASTYLTVVHEDEQEIRYARNTRDGFALPEGLHVPWSDTLCKRALDEGRVATTDVPEVWGDSDAARDLGIQVYVSVPVRRSDGRLWGTLCAADSEAAEGLDEHLPTMRLFSRLIASEVERAEAVARATVRASEAERVADTDHLTSCATRRVVEPWLVEHVEALGPDELVVVAFVDVDDFKLVNDELGHEVGDSVLVDVASRLRAASRPGDLVARLGGDEFLVAARMPRTAGAAFAARVRSTSAFEMPVPGGVRVVRTSVGVATSDEHEAAALVAAADRAMYVVKRA